ncbi:NUDIX domain-containing protein [Kribbella sp. NPDC051770]|uniref:NUDIX domain-containing protein n=1 Tax=Kribbella sp. NPDC051770 TaxID=3155413 RepID=UPI0034483778
MPIPRAAAVVVDGPRALLIKRYLRQPPGRLCVMCEAVALGPTCPGHSYAVLPGGHVEPGETPETTALRELTEETTLTATIARLLHTGTHNGRVATYYLMTNVTGTPVLSGPEAQAHSPNDSYELLWADPADFAALGLYPPDVVRPLTELLLG